MRLKILAARHTWMYFGVLCCAVSLSLLRSEVSLRNYAPQITTTSHDISQTQQSLRPQHPKHCALWADNQDDWWQDHPDWKVAKENETHLCFSPMKNAEDAEYYREMHRFAVHRHPELFQHLSTGAHWNGFCGSRFSVDRRILLLFCYPTKDVCPIQALAAMGRGFTIHPTMLRYPPIQQPLGGCESQDLFCYYLPVTNCDYDEVNKMLSEKVPRTFLDKTNAYQNGRDPETAEAYRHHMSYFTRLNQQTRHGLYQLFEEIAPPSRKPSNQKQESQPSQWGNCIAFHVRRTDASSERQHPRNFYPLQSYIDGARQVTNLTAGDNIVLLTDDDSTIREAKILHPEYNWLYIDRKRYFGAQKKNQHFPSGDPALEFLNIYADLKMAAPCHTLIHGTSNMVIFIVHAMEQAMADYYNEMCFDRNSNSSQWQPSTSAMKDGTTIDCGNIPKLITKLQIDANQSNITYVSGKLFTEELQKRINEAEAKDSEKNNGRNDG